MRNIKNEIYISVDVEASGPIPLEYSMLSFGAAAFTEDGELIDTFERNLEELPDAKRHPDTMLWWATQPKAWEECRKNLETPKRAMIQFDIWLKKLKSQTNANPVFIGYPASFDFMFIYVYLIKFVGYSIFSFSALDMKTYAYSLLNIPFRQAVKKNFPKSWRSKKKHTHVALNDAIEQGETFFKMRKQQLGELNSGL